MKPYRVKRGGKFIGSFLVVHDGKRVNLGLPGDPCKDASEARRRAALVERGQWPPQGNDAAVAVKVALEGVESTGMLATPQPSALPLPETVEAKTDSATASVAEVAEAVEPPGAPVMAADAVNATAADDDGDLEDQAKSALANAGIDLTEITAKAPQLLSGAHLWVQAQALRFNVRLFVGQLGTEKPWPTAIVPPPEDEFRQLIGKLWAKKLESMNLDLSKIGPGWWLLLLSAAAGFGQVAAMLEEVKATEQKESAAGTN